MLHGECEDCGKGYKVPRSDVAYACKECGGTILVEVTRHGQEEPATAPAPAAPPPRLHHTARHHRAKHARHADREEHEHHAHHYHHHRRHHGSSRLRTALPIALGLVGGITLLVVIYVLTRPPSIEEIEKQFRAAWNAGDAAAVAAFFGAEKAERNAEALRKSATSREWKDGDWPKLAEPILHERQSGSFEITHPVGRDQLITLWHDVQDQWTLVQLDMTGLQSESQTAPRARPDS